MSRNKYSLESQTVLDVDKALDQAGDMGVTVTELGAMFGKHPVNMQKVLSVLKDAGLAAPTHGQGSPRNRWGRPEFLQAIRDRADSEYKQRRQEADKKRKRVARSKKREAPTDFERDSIHRIVTEWKPPRITAPNSVFALAEAA